MRTSHSQPTTPCKKFWIAFAVCVSVTGGAWAQLAPNQTHGFGNNRLITFTYLQKTDGDSVGRPVPSSRLT